MKENAIEGATRSIISYFISYPNSMLTFTSYNGHGTGKDKLPYIQKLCKIGDFVLVQEHWLHDKDNNFFENNLLNVKSHYFRNESYCITTRAPIWRLCDSLK